MKKFIVPLMIFSFGFSFAMDNDEGMKRYMEVMKTLSDKIKHYAKEEFSKGEHTAHLYFSGSLLSTDSFNIQEGQTIQGIFLEYKDAATWAFLTPIGRRVFVLRTAVRGEGDKRLLKKLEDEGIIEHIADVPRVLSCKREGDIVVPGVFTKFFNVNEGLPRACFKEGNPLRNSQLVRIVLKKNDNKSHDEPLEEGDCQ